MDFNKMTREELRDHYVANVAERKRLNEENTLLNALCQQSTISSEKRTSAETKVLALQAKLAKLTAVVTV